MVTIYKVKNNILFLFPHPDFPASRARQRPILRPAAAAQGQKHPILPLATGFSRRQGQNSPSAPLADSGGPENMLDVCHFPPQGADGIQNLLGAGLGGPFDAVDIAG